MMMWTMSMALLFYSGGVDRKKLRSGDFSGIDILIEDDVISDVIFASITVHSLAHISSANTFVQKQNWNLLSQPHSRKKQKKQKTKKETKTKTKKQK